MTELSHARSKVLFGAAINVLFSAVKVVGGILGNSYALIADGVESLLDIFSSLVVWAGLKAAELPANERHPYGYGRAESLAALVISLVLVTTALGLIIQSIREIVTPHHAPAPFTLIILIAVVAGKEWLARVIGRHAQELQSAGLRSDAWHHRADALTSFTACIGITIALLGGPGYEAADDYAALIASLIIATNGVLLVKAPLRDLLDAAPGPHFSEEVRRIAATVPGVHAVEKCRVRRAGIGYFVDLHIIVDGAISVRDGHEIARAVRRVLSTSALRIHDVLVHIEPAD